MEEAQHGPRRAALLRLVGKPSDTDVSVAIVHVAAADRTRLLTAAFHGSHYGCECASNRGVVLARSQHVRARHISRGSATRISSAALHVHSQTECLVECVLMARAPACCVDHHIVIEGPIRARRLIKELTTSAGLRSQPSAGRPLWPLSR